MNDIIIWSLISFVAGGIVGLFVAAICNAARDNEKPKVLTPVLGTDIAMVAITNKKLGYVRGISEFAERARQRAGWRRELYIHEIDDIQTELIAKTEADQ